MLGKFSALIGGDRVMNELKFQTLMTRARNFSSLGERSDYWRGYQRGLRRGFQGELYGSDQEHQLWMRLADDSTDPSSRERGLGYRDGFSACDKR